MTIGKLVPAKVKHTYARSIITDFPNGKAHYGAIASTLGVG
ncbi:MULTISPECIES: hypothetical protein [Bacillus cereus group]|nr:hypothetical protein [Bacillus cereus group sp. Bc253]MDA2157649.1 hypothetical protein [Bacillus cereus group sp. Bc253]